MNNAELKTTLTELMNQYNTARRAWLASHGNDKGFHAWFTKQTTGEGLFTQAKREEGEQ